MLNNNLFIPQGGFAVNMNKISFSALLVVLLLALPCKFSLNPPGYAETLAIERPSGIMERLLPFSIDDWVEFRRFAKRTRFSRIGTSEEASDPPPNER